MRIAVIATVLFLVPVMARAQSFVNWENPHVHPLDITPDGSRLLAVNTPDNRLEVFDITGGTAVPIRRRPRGARSRLRSRAN